MTRHRPGKGGERMILVTGATGANGREVLRGLAAKAGISPPSRAMPPISSVS